MLERVVAGEYLPLKLCKSWNVLFLYRIWTCFEHSLIHLPELMKDRHLDQLLMCAIYVMGKVSYLLLLLQLILYSVNYFTNVLFETLIDVQDWGVLIAVLASPYILYCNRVFRAQIGLINDLRIHKQS